MHIINLSKVETVFPFFKKRDVILSRVLLKQQCRLSAQVEWGWEKWEKTHRQLYQINFQCAYPNYISQFWPDYHFNIYVWWCHLCQVWSHVKQLLCILLQLPDIFPIYERQGVSGWHTCAVPHMALACSPVCRQICPMPTVAPARHYKPQLGIRAQSSTLQAWARHCPVDASGLVVHCARWTDTCQFMWGRVGVEAACFFLYLEGF